jgi:3-dehydro-L-gulonate 2-dehydrogenase
MDNIVLVSPGKMKDAFLSILLKHQFEKDRAETCAGIFTKNTVDGVYTHGINRFASFISMVENGFVVPNNEPLKLHATNALEQWDGQLAPGVLNAIKATDGAVRLAKANGIGCVALANTNHWMRGGYYGWRAAENNCVFIGWTNTIANMPAWGAVDAKLGNNPLVMAVPYRREAIVLDMAASQFSYGALHLAKMRNEELPVDGGFDNEGRLTRKPSEIIESKRVLPVGYWKGAGLSLLLDILSAVLSAGWSTHEISKRKSEYALSQTSLQLTCNS